MYSVTADS